MPILKVTIDVPIFFHKIVAKVMRSFDKQVVFNCMHFIHICLSYKYKKGEKGIPSLLVGWSVSFRSDIVLLI